MYSFTAKTMYSFTTESVGAGKNGLKEVRLGIAAVFDGHGGSEASEMASHLLLNYFHLHYVSKMYKLMVQQYKGELTMAESKSLLLQLLKESLLSTIHDIDVKFTQVSIMRHSLDFDSRNYSSILLLVTLHVAHSLSSGGS